MSTAVVTALFTYPTSYWFLPVIGGLVSISGVFLKKRVLNNLGIMVTGVSFYVLNRYLDFTDLNLIVILGVFFALYASWNLANREVLVRSIKKDTSGKKRNRMLNEFKISWNKNLILNLLLAFAISWGGIYTARYSALDIELNSMNAIPLSIFFGVLIFAIIYVLIEKLPEYTD